MWSEQVTERTSLQGAIYPVSQGAGTVQPTAGVDMQKHRRALWILKVGVMAGGSTVDMKLQESANQNMSAATDVAGTNVSITQLLAAGGNNRTVSLEIRAEQVTKRYLGVLVTVATAASLIDAQGIGLDGNEKPEKANDPAAVAQRNVAS